MRTKKCPNCEAGQVDGGFKKRIKREMKRLENQEDAELNNLNKIKGREKRRVEEKRIKEKYRKLATEKSNETPRIVSGCGYCGGTGVR